MSFYDIIKRLEAMMDPRYDGCLKETMLLMSKCIKLLNSSLDTNIFINRLCNICNMIYENEKNPALLMYLVDKLVLSIFMLEHGFYADSITNLIFDGACCFRSSLQCKCLKSISQESKKNCFDLERYYKYLLFINQQLRTNLSMKSNLEELQPVYYYIKLYKQILGKIGYIGDSSIHAAFNDVLETALQWLHSKFSISTEDESDQDDLDFRIKIFQVVTSITEQISKEKYKFDLQTIISYCLQTVHKIVLCSSNICGTVVDQTENIDNGIMIKKQTARSLIMSLLKGIIYCGDKETDVKKILTVIQTRENNIKDVQCNVINLLHDLFMDQDDDVIEFISLLFQVQAKFKNLRADINPHSIFHELCKAVTFDESVFLDWLINENSSTIFAAYLRKYVQFITSNFRAFTKSFEKKTSGAVHRDADKMSTSLVNYSSSSDDAEDLEQIYSQHVDNIMSCLIRLHLKLERMENNGLLDEKFNFFCPLFDQLEILYES